MCTMCLLGAHGSGEGLGYSGAGICTLLGAAIWELGVQQGFSGREASVLVSLQHSSLYSLKYLHLGKEYLLFTFSSHAKASLSYALQWFHIHTHLPGRLYLSGPFVESSSRQPVRRILSRAILKLYLKRAREREEAKGCHWGSEELISETMLKQYQ